MYRVDRPILKFYHRQIIYITAKYPKSRYVETLNTGGHIFCDILCIGFVLEEISVRAPRTLFICLIIIKICNGSKHPTNIEFNFENKCTDTLAYITQSVIRKVFPGTISRRVNEKKCISYSIKCACNMMTGSYSGQYLNYNGGMTGSFA